MTHTILITGANRGIGLELVKQYSEKGWRVIACCRKPHEASALQSMHQANQHIQIHALDVSDLDSIHQFANSISHEVIDILFNNAGITGENQSFGNVTASDLMRVYTVNTVAPILLSQALEANVMKSERKIIVNMTSLLGSIALNLVSDWKWLSYRASKSALNAATRTMANELKEKGVIAIVMSPGWVKTDMGGQDAYITVEECVSGIVPVVDRLTLEDSGHFFEYTGKQLPW